MRIVLSVINSTDLIGLGFENFDGIGRWRTQENGATIDASGELDGHTFDNAWELAQKYRTIKTSQSV